VAVRPRTVEEVVKAAAGFWRDKRVLLTGHTGFKGAWLALWLHRLGARVTGLALAPATTPSLFELARVGQRIDSRIVDVRDAASVKALVHEVQPQVTLHLAAQALVRPGYREPLATMATNVMGTAHVLDALRGVSDARVAVVVTTDKVYRNREWSYPYREDDALGGHDPYSASKAAAELVSSCWRDAFLREQGVAVATARAGNVIGGGDWAQDRLLPDAIRAWQAGEVLTLRLPRSTRPWQHVLDPLAGYLRLAEHLWDDASLAGAYNFGPQPHDAAAVQDVVALAQQAYGSGGWRVAHNAADEPHEAGWLALEVALARDRLGVTPTWPLAEAVRRTMRWYRHLADGADARALCELDITEHEAAGTKAAAVAR